MLWAGWLDKICRCPFSCSQTNIFYSNDIINLWAKPHSQANFINFDAETSTGRQLISKPNQPKTREKALPISLINSFHHNTNIIVSTLLCHSDKLEFLCTSAFLVATPLLIRKITGTVNKVIIFYKSYLFPLPWHTPNTCYFYWLLCHPVNTFASTTDKDNDLNVFSCQITRGTFPLKSSTYWVKMTAQVSISFSRISDTLHSNFCIQKTGTDTLSVLTWLCIPIFHQLTCDIQGLQKVSKLLLLFTQDKVNH